MFINNPHSIKAYFWKRLNNLEDVVNDIYTR